MDSALTNQTYHSILLILSFYIQIPICVIGFLLNVINVILFYYNIIHSDLYFLVSSLSLADAVTLILRTPQGLIRQDCWPLCSNPELRIYAYIFIVFVEVPVTNVTETISNWLTLSLAIDRYMAMKHHTFSKINCTLRNFRILTALICSIATIINLPYFFTYNVSFRTEFNVHSNVSESTVYTDPTLFSNSTFYIYHSWSRQVIVQFLPLLLLCIFNFLLFQIVYNHNRKLVKSHSCINNLVQMKQLRETQKLILKTSISNQMIKEKSKILEKKLRAQKKLTILLIIVILLFLIGQIPHSFAYIKIYEALGPCSTSFPECFEYQLFRASTMVLTLLCYSLNFFIYLFLNTHFRRTLFYCVNSEERRPTIKNGIQIQFKPQPNFGNEEEC